ncbi:hypothetical protein [Parabacteroides sp.]
MKESNSSFLCPTNCVITGRRHTGDKDGNPVSGVITVEDVQWHTAIKESFGYCTGLIPFIWGIKSK